MVYGRVTDLRTDSGSNMSASEQSGSCAPRISFVEMQDRNEVMLTVMCANPETNLLAYLSPTYWGLTKCASTLHRVSFADFSRIFLGFVLVRLCIFIHPQRLTQRFSVDIVTVLLF